MNETAQLDATARWNGRFDYATSSRLVHSESWNKVDWNATYSNSDAVRWRADLSFFVDPDNPGPLPKAKEASITPKTPVKL